MNDAAQGMSRPGSSSNAGPATGRRLPHARIGQRGRGRRSEAWLRLNARGSDAIDNLGGWLTPWSAGCASTCCARASLVARTTSARGRPSRSPASMTTADPEQETLLADAVGVALLVVLETLRPTERLAFVLHDMFAVPFDEIAPIVGRSPAGSPTARQPRPPPRPRRRAESEPDVAKQRGSWRPFSPPREPAISMRCSPSSTPGRVPGRFRRDPRGLVPSPAQRGPPNRRRHAVAQGSRFASLCPLPRAGQRQPPDSSSAPQRRPIGAVGFTVTSGLITTIDLILDPDKLGGVAV